MNRCLWIAMRFCLCAWLGAAALFVVAGIREVTSPGIDQPTKNLLVTLRFPPYYLFGFSLVGIGTLSSVLLRCSGWNPKCRRRLSVIAVFGILTLLIMAADYLWIYSPLESMMLRPDGTVPAEFHSYHVWSKNINAIAACTCLVAALLSVVEPRRSTSASDAGATG
ncbi:hypothetical protein GC176_13630 [bacterium]|nr:hypothetical protein [bacterium]